ncbi:MAG: ferredoxin--NADP reductase [Capnocytophaga sp.]|nr:ferredoxin--NADP reductase [Capnocytophaga sp.]
MHRFYKLTVLRIERLTSVSVKITFDLPELLQKEFAFEAGMYLTLQQTINNQKVRRAYSICSATNEKELSIAVKKVPNGIFSAYLTTELKKGDILEVMPPEGIFVFLPYLFNDKDIILFSAGSGVTPMMSIAKTALAETDVKVVFVYGNKTKEETLFLDEIEKLQKLYPNRFFVHYVFSQQKWNNHFSGRIDEHIIAFIFKKYGYFNLGRYYICGPNTMVSSVKKNLLERGIASEYIFTELFEATAVPVNDVSALQGSVRITYIIDRKETTFESSKSKSLLTSILSQGVDVPYSCLNGVCSSCIGKIIEGQAQMVKNETLVDKEIKEGYVLTCQAHPITDFIKITYDV